jgi:hypothetical protein
MKLDRIEHLASLLPPRNVYTHMMELGPDVQDNMAEEISVYGHSVMDPAFGWKLIKSFLDSGLPLPPEIHESPLSRAYCFYKYNNGDAELRTVFMLRLKIMKTVRACIECMLLVEKFTHEQIGDEIGATADIIDAYETLFWNVRDRLKERAYIASVLYPESTQVLWNPDYHIQEDYQSMSWRAAWLHGIDTSRAFLGMQRQTEEHDAEMHARVFESQVISTSSYSARMGLLHQGHAPSIDRGRAIVQSSKLGGDNKQTSDDQLGMGSFGMLPNMLEHFRRISEPDVQHRLNLQKLQMQKQLKEESVSG